MPSMSVVVAYFFPVRVVVAVTATPGNGTPLAFTVPRMVPPCASTGAAGAAAVAAGAAVAGADGAAGAVVAGAAGAAVAGAAGAAVAGAAGVCSAAGACVVAAPVSCARAVAPKSPAQTNIAATIANPPTSLIRFTRRTNHAPFSRPYRTQRTSKPPRLVATDIKSGSPRCHPHPLHQTPKTKRPCSLPVLSNRPTITVEQRTAAK